MDPFVFMLLLGGAACHAAWNAMIKLRLEPLDATILISIGCGIIALPGLLLFGLPAEASWIFIVASLVVHFAYYITLAEAYRTGDLGQVYPIARGAAPLLTALAGLLILQEPIGPLGWAGLLTLTSGIGLLSVRGHAAIPHLERRATRYALATAASIAAYSIVDGVGARLSANALGYASVLFVADGVMMLVFGLALRGRSLLRSMGQLWPTVMVGGLFSTVSYAIAIWAMTQAPLALVAAVRETSVLFAAVLSVVLLKERVVPARIMAAALVVAGLVTIRLR